MHSQNIGLVVFVVIWTCQPFKTQICYVQRNLFCLPWTRFRGASGYSFIWHV